MPARIITAEGARAAESFLLAELQNLTRADAALAQPVYVVVPSNSLRVHLLARIAEAHGAQAGLSVITLRRLAFEVLRRAGGAVRDGSALFPLLVRRHAREQDALARVLDGLEDGYASVSAAANDLLDAGLADAQADAVFELLAECWPGTVGERAAAVARVALEARRDLQDAGRVPRAGVFSAACEELERAPELLRARALWVYGYADVTGTQGDFLLALLRAFPGGIVFDEPPNPAPRAGDVTGGADASDVSNAPAARAREDGGRGVLFLERLQRRVRELEASEEHCAPAPPPKVALFRAPGPQAEVREVAERVAQLVASGVPDERIGVVARDLAPFAHALRAQFDRVGVAYSGLGTHVPLPTAHRVRALLQLLRERERAPLDTWLDADAAFPRELTRDLRLAFHVLGFLRLEQLEHFDPAERFDGHGNFTLPLRHSPDEDAPPDATPASDERAPRLTMKRRKVRGADLQDACARARALLKLLKAWPQRAPFETHRAHFRALRDKLLKAWPQRAPFETHRAHFRALREDVLGADEGVPGERDLRREIGALQGDVGADFELTAAEWPVLLERALAGIGAQPLGGAGGGVAVLGSVEARARTFEHLFLIGLNRDSFPRIAREDPLLPEKLRERLEVLLPDIPLKKRSYTEERYLFAQLCASSPKVTLSFSTVSDDNKHRPPSTFIERVRLAQNLEELPLVPEWLAAREGRALPSDESAALFHLEAPRAERARAAREFFETALADVPQVLTPVGAQALPAPRVWAEGRVAVARELDAHGTDLGPYFGWTGARDASEVVPVTRLEALARCPWQSFLQSELRLEERPDAHATLPTLSPLLIGNLLHKVLEKIAQEAGAPVEDDLDVDAPGVPVAWPDARRFAQWMREIAQRLLNEEGLHTPGFMELLVERVMPMFLRVREWDFRARTPQVIGAEVNARVSVPGEGGARTIVFRADRADRLPDGGLLLTDYKTGRPVHGNVKKESTKQRNWLQKVREGTALQVTAYLEAGATRARYLYADPARANDEELASTKDATPLRAAFQESARVLLAQREAGAFAPRLVELGTDNTPRACDYCAVQGACWQSDTFARRRLADWLAQPRADETPTEMALRAAWQLGQGE